MKKFFRSRDKEEKPKGPYAESISLSELEKMGDFIINISQTLERILMNNGK